MKNFINDDDKIQLFDVIQLIQEVNINDVNYPLCNVQKMINSSMTIMSLWMKT